MFGRRHQGPNDVASSMISCAPPTKSLRLRLPASQLAALHDAATLRGVTAADIALEAIGHWLRQEKRHRIRQEVAEFAAIYAGTEWDLDPAWEAAGLESVANLPPWDGELPPTLP